MSTKTVSRKDQQTNNNLLWWIIGGVIGLGLIVWLAFAIASEQPRDDSIGFGEVAVQGEPLPQLTDPAADPAVGTIAPTVSGADANGIETTIGPNGRSKIIAFLAHWCPHCQREVPIVQDWLDDGNLPDNVDMYSITVLTDPLRPEWPPQDWLEEEGWTVPYIMDDEIGSAAVAYGLAGTPMYVVLGGDGSVIQRVSGEIGTTGLDTLVQMALAADSLDG